MSYSVCERSGGMCTGCMMCLRDKKPEYYKRLDSYEETLKEIIEWFGDPWELLLSIIKYSELFAEDNEEFARVPKVVTEDEVFIHWDDGIETYPKDEVEQWTSYDFASYLALHNENTFVSVYEKEKEIFMKEYLKK